MLTIQSLGNIKNHGHLTSHNVFVELKKIAKNAFYLKVKIADVENYDFMEYSNMFFNYRVATVWSAPECLEHMKRMNTSTI